MSSLGPCLRAILSSDLLPLRQSRLDQIAPLEIGLQMQDRAIDQQLCGWTPPVRGGVEVPQRLEVLQPLPFDQGHRVRQPYRGGDRELHEELVLEPSTRNWRLDPPGQLLPAGVGQLVQTFAPVVARNDLADHQPVPLEPGQGRVDLARVHHRKEVTELGLERLPDPVAVLLLSGEHGHEQLPHKLREYIAAIRQSTVARSYQRTAGVRVVITELRAALEQRVSGGPARHGLTPSLSYPTPSWSGSSPLWWVGTVRLPPPWGRLRRSGGGRSAHCR